MKREPITVGGAIIIFVKALIAWLSVVEIVDLTDAQQQATITMVVSGIDVITVIVALGLARSRTTSLYDAQDDEGVSLMRVDGKPPVRRG